MGCRDGMQGWDAGVRTRVSNPRESMEKKTGRSSARTAHQWCKRSGSTHLVDGHDTPVLRTTAQASSDRAQAHTPHDPPHQQGAVGLVLVVHDDAACLQAQMCHDCAPGPQHMGPSCHPHARAPYSPARSAPKAPLGQPLVFHTPAAVSAPKVPSGSYTAHW
jgi:hypothetical protein